MRVGHHVERKIGDYLFHRVAPPITKILARREFAWEERSEGRERRGQNCLISELFASEEALAIFSRANEE